MAAADNDEESEEDMTAAEMATKPTTATALGHKYCRTRGIARLECKRNTLY